MLKITRAVLSKKESTLRLDGRITGQWVGLLQESAQFVLDEEVTLSVDLKNVSFIDWEGIALLRSLLDQGAYVLNAPLFLVEQIGKRKDAQS